jgi:LysM repeat protein
MATSAAIKAGLRRYIKDITFAKPAKKNKDPDRKIVGTPSKVTQETKIKKGQIATEEFAGKPSKGHGSLFDGTLKKIFGKDVGDVTMSVKQDMKSYSNRVSKNAKKLIKKDPSLSQEAAIKKAEKDTAKMFGARFFKGTRKKEVAKKAQIKSDIRKNVSRVATGVAGVLAGSKIASMFGKDSKDYKVKSGDTLSEIARDKGTTVGKIKKANPNIKNLNKIKPGQTIKIPMPKVKDRKSVYQDLTRAEMKKLAIKKRAGGGLIDPPNPGAAALPRPVRNKMGFKKRGGAVVKRAVGGGVALRGLGAVRKV